MPNDVAPHSPMDSSHRQGVARRQVVALLFGILPAVSAASAASAAVCLDLNALSPSEKGLRDSLNFKLHSQDAVKQCHSCAFFEAAADGCGRCQLLTGGPVFPDSVCDSFAKKD